MEIFALVKEEQGLGSLRVLLSPWSAGNHLKMTEA